MPHGCGVPSFCAEMTLIALIALEPLEHDGRTIEKGEAFHAKPVKAAALRYRKKAMFASEAPKTQPVRKKRTYQRRDMQAED